LPEDRLAVVAAAAAAALAASDGCDDDEDDGVDDADCPRSRVFYRVLSSLALKQSNANIGIRKIPLCCN